MKEVLLKLNCLFFSALALISALPECYLLSLEDAANFLNTKGKAIGVA